MDDFLQYKLYHAKFLKVLSNDVANKKAFLNLGRSLIDSVDKLCTNYLWRKDCFYIEPEFINLNNNNNNNGARISNFNGTMYYGNDIEDEWFVVYLLYKLSSINENILIEINDNDGQFLLIHCAYKLPSWIDPKNVENRVYIYKNQLHIIPLSYNIQNNKLKSIQLILNNSINTIANINIQNEINLKLNKLSNNISKNPGINHHASIVILPQQCANILDKYPFIISFIVDEYINSDNKQNVVDHNKQIKYKQRRFKLNPNDYVFRSIRFTRYLYGCLVSKPLKSAPMYFRKHKFDFKQYSILIGNKLKLNKRIVENGFLNGIKIMIGFELLYEKCKQNMFNHNNDKHWIKFKHSLIKKGYFTDYIPFSNEYKVRQQKAKEYYEKYMKTSNNDTCDNDGGLCVSNGIHPDKAAAFLVDVMDKKESNYNNDWIKVYDDNTNGNVMELFNKLQNDNEDWLNISNQDLNDLLNEYSYMNDDKQKQMLFEEMLDDNDDDNDDSDDDDDDGDKDDKLNAAKQQTKDDILSLQASLNTFMDKQSSISGIEIDVNQNDNDFINFDADKVINILANEQSKKLNVDQKLMKDVMSKMDKELLLKQKKKQKDNDDNTDNKDNKDDDIDDNDELNVDLNVVNDILQSHITSQTSGSGIGPAATLLSQLGLQLK